MDDRQKQFEQLSAYLDGELTASEALDLQRALAADEELAGELESLRRTRELLRGLPTEPAPDNFTRSVMARVQHSHPAIVGRGSGGVFWASRWISFAAAAVVLIAAGAGMYIVIHSPSGGRDVQHAVEPESTIAVAELPTEHIFTADLVVAQEEVTDVLRRNCIVMTDYVQTAGRRNALSAPRGAAAGDRSQIVRTRPDTVEIEVLVEPQVARQIITELVSVQARQLSMADSIGLGYMEREGRPAETTDESLFGAEDVAESAERDKELKLQSPGDLVDGGLSRGRSSPQPDELTDGAKPGEAAAGSGVTVPSAQAKRDESDVEALPRPISPRAAADSDDSAAKDQPTMPVEEGPDSDRQGEGRKLPAGYVPGRPWFGEEEVEKDASRPEGGAAGPLENEATPATKLPASAEGQPSPSGIKAMEASESATTGTAGADGLDKTIVSGEVRQRVSEVEIAEKTDEDVPAAPEAPFGDRSEGVQLQRLVIVLQQVPAEYLPRQAGESDGDAERSTEQDPETRSD